MATPFEMSAPAQDARDGKELRKAKSYALIASPSGKDLFVQAQEYDPLARHRPDDKVHNEGEGLGFMFSCFSWCLGPAAPPPPPPEPAATAERHYSLPPSESMANLIQNKES